MTEHGYGSGACPDVRYNVHEVESEIPDEGDGVKENKLMKEESDKPKWDVALEALLREEYGKKGDDLILDDMRRLAVIHAIRFDDIMETLIEMCVHGEWQYRDTSGVPHVIDRDTADRLFATGRLAEKNLDAYPGGWRRV